MENKFVCKNPFEKKIRYRIVSLSDDSVCTYKLEIERYYKFDPDFWINDLLSYSDDFMGLIRILRCWLQVDSVPYDFFADEKEWVYHER